MTAKDDVFLLRAKIDELDTMTHQLAQKLPKAERHVLAASLRAVVDNIIRLEVQVSYQQGSEARRRVRPEGTYRLLCRLDAEVGLFKRKVQQTANLGYVPRHISAKAHAEWAALAQEVGSLLGAWLKTVETRLYPARGVQPQQGQLR